MKKILLTSLLISLIFCSCKNEESEYADLLIGKWLNTMVDDEPVLTDASFMCEYKSNNVELYAIGVQLDDNNKLWAESDDYIYDIDGNNIIIDGNDSFGKTYHIEFEIISLNQTTLKYSVKEFFVDGVDYPDSKIYTDKKITVDNREDFTGIWYGHCTTAGTSDTKYHYWEYFEDGSFNYYYKDDNDKWIKKSDNEGGYFLYGDFLATNYTNDLVSGGTGKAYECWNIDITGNEMTWTGLRNNNNVITYQMEKVPLAPTIN